MHFTTMSPPLPGLHDRGCLGLCSLQTRRYCCLCLFPLHINSPTRSASLSNRQHLLASPTVAVMDGRASKNRRAPACSLNPSHFASSLSSLPQTPTAMPGDWQHWQCRRGGVEGRPVASGRSSLLAFWLLPNHPLFVASDNGILRISHHRFIKRNSYENSSNCSA